MIRKITYFIFAIAVSVSCQKILFNDDAGTREISLSEFTSVKISGIYNIELVQDNVNKLVISGSNNINAITASIRNDTLVIDDHKGISLNPERNNLRLHFRKIDYIITYDPVNISNQDTIKSERFLYYPVGEIAEADLLVDCDFLQIVNSDNTLGTIKISGKAEYFSVFNRYGCTIFAGDLSCKYADITNESIGYVYIDASVSISAYLWGPGNIIYYGSPEIKIIEKKGDGGVLHGN